MSETSILSNAAAGLRNILDDDSKLPPQQQLDEQTEDGLEDVAAEMRTIAYKVPSDSPQRVAALQKRFFEIYDNAVMKFVEAGGKLPGSIYKRIDGVLLAMTQATVGMNADLRQHAEDFDIIRAYYDQLKSASRYEADRFTAFRNAEYRVTRSLDFTDGAFLRLGQDLVREIDSTKLSREYSFEQLEESRQKAVDAYDRIEKRSKEKGAEARVAHEHWEV